MSRRTELLQFEVKLRPDSRQQVHAAGQICASFAQRNTTTCILSSHVASVSESITEVVTEDPFLDLSPLSGRATAAAPRTPSTT
jgi:hypothetical protein